ncbi:hypothetical protein C5167_016419 [Papaver somniferum]|nr:hypothetical protein C5167_016419 [Papaver somniferum]
MTSVIDVVASFAPAGEIFPASACIVGVFKIIVSVLLNHKRVIKRVCNHHIMELKVPTERN